MTYANCAPCHCARSVPPNEIRICRILPSTVEFYLKRSGRLLERIRERINPEKGRIWYKDLLGSADWADYS
ncbi:unnamed protein product [Adineta ricciae]|uniref:Uncharacterized protein n=1 Tax=Adineta ricciae TaxID=249248 RepID=A0A814UFR6_ADIRI|nr:unnamed protein product [Adineta ricciae]